MRYELGNERVKWIEFKYEARKDARYTLDAGRRSSSTKDRTRYRYTLPHIATL
uniref:Uncharacterized protein n=1 Tax=Helianthus annuus TaxID=4232 RepID=A0A251UJS4_HELAN